jgi:Ala-tRNA(Pro) deacylase
MFFEAVVEFRRCKMRNAMLAVILIGFSSRVGDAAALESCRALLLDEWRPTMDRTLKTFLDKSGVKYEIVQHAPTFTAMETAEATHVAGKELAKTVIVRLDSELAMVIVPATHSVDLDKLQVLTGANQVVLADELDFRDRFKDCETGAMPPFGKLYGMPIFVSDALLEDEHLVFQAGSHTEAVKMSTADYMRLESPTVHRLSRPRELV